MDAEDQDRMWGAITAQNALLEHLWCFVLESDVAAERVAAARAICAKMLRETDLPDDAPPSDARFRAHQHSVSTLEEFWQRVEERVRPE